MSRQLQAIQSGAVLAGFTATAGKPWWFQANRGMEKFLYEGAIPTADVEQHIGFTVVDRPVYTETSEGIVVIPGKRAWIREDNGTVFGIHSEKYNGHSYNEWLHKNVLQTVGGEADVANVGLLNGGAVAYVQIAMPESVDAPAGVKVRPFILATTSFDGSIATTFKTGFTNVVCDNTYGMFMAEKTETYRVRHTRNSAFDVLSAGDALNTLHLIADQTTREIERLLSVEVSDRQWGAFVQAHAPVIDDKGTALSGRSVSLAETKRSAITGLYRTDIRVAPWAGTAWGVVQAVNTYNQHLAIVRGTDRVNRTMLRAVKDQIGSDDRGTLATLSTVIGRDLL